MKGLFMTLHIKAILLGHRPQSLEANTATVTFNCARYHIRRDPDRPLQMMVINCRHCKEYSKE